MASTTTAKETQTRDSNVYVGIALDVNNRTVELAPTTPINRIDEYGLELELPENLYLGQLQSGIDALVGQFSPGFKFKDYEEQAAGIPALQNIIKKVGTAEITIQDLHLKIPPEKKKEDGSLYTLAMSATWPVDAKADKLADGGFNLTLRGLYVMVTNETADEIATRRARAKALQKKAEALLQEATVSSNGTTVTETGAETDTESTQQEPPKPGKK